GASSTSRRCGVTTRCSWPSSCSRRSLSCSGTSWRTSPTVCSTRGSRTSDNERAVPMRERPALSESWRRFRRHRLAMADVITLARIVVAVLLAGPSPYDPATTNLRLRFEGPSPAHPFGTDDLGRDTLTRVLYGGRVSLLVGL